MKQKTYPTVNKSLQVYIYFGEKKFAVASRQAVIDWLVHSKYKTYLSSFMWGSWKLISRLTDVYGQNLSLYYLYSDAYSIYRIKKKKFKKKRKNDDGRERGYFPSRKERDPIDRNEPQPRRKGDRGPFHYDDPWERKSERSWKSFRTHQYKI